MKQVHFQVSLYSFEAFSEELKGTFQPPIGPYRKDADVSYLKDLTVFFYRDEFHSEGVVIPSEEIDVFHAGGFKAFKHLV